MKLDQADVKSSVWSFLTIGLMAVVFILAGKYLTTRFPVPGLTDLFKSV